MKASTKTEMRKRRKLLEQITGTEWQYFRRFAASKLGNTFDAEDAVSDGTEAFLKSYPVERGLAGVSGWMVQTIKFVCLRTNDKTKRRAVYLAPEATDEITSKLSTYEASLTTILENVSVELRAPVILRLGGYSLNETAKILDRPRGSVRYQLALVKADLQTANIEPSIEGSPELPHSSV